MGRIQSSVGLVSGIDIGKTVEQLIAISARPRDLLTSRTDALKNQQIAVNELTALVIGVQLGSDRLGRSDNFQSFSVSSSDSDTLTATASSGTSPGRYQFQTIQTAQSATLTSSAFTSENDQLSEGELVVRTGGFVDGSTRLDELRGGSGVSLGKIQITDRSGAAREVDLRFAFTVEDVLKKINNTQGIDVQASIDGQRIVLADTSGETASNLIVEEVGTGQTATDLGLSGIDVAANTATGDDIVFVGKNTKLSTLLDGQGVHFGSGKDLLVHLSDGTDLEIDLNSSSDPVTVGQLLDRINAKDATKLKAQISSDGNGIELVDLTDDSEAFEISSPTGNLTKQLGLGAAAVDGTITGRRLLSGLSGPLLSSLNGGDGYDELGEIDITNRAGVTTSVDLAGAETLRDVIDLINDSGASVVATLNSSRTGIAIQDNTGSNVSNLIVADGDDTDTATQLSIAANTTDSSLDSGSLKLQYINENTALSTLRNGNGIRLGTIKITNSAGEAGTVNLASLKLPSIGDVVDAVNKLDLDVVAKLNDEGDGIVIVDNSSGSGQFTIADVGTGKSASDLRIAGTGSTIQVDGENETAINGSQTFRLDVAEDTTLSELVKSINAGDGPVTASLLNAGPNHVRLLLSSKNSGEAGRIFAEGNGLGTTFSVTAQGRDAALAIGSSDDSGGTLLRSTTNTFKNVVTGLEINLSGLNDSPVEITVSESSETAEKNIKLFVDQFNKVVDKLKTLTSFDAATNTTGLLFGSAEVLRVETTLSRFITSRFNGSGNIKSSEQLGISLDETGKLSFDSAKFRDQVSIDPEAVEEFFTKAETGFAARAKTILDTLSGGESSVLINRNRSLQDKIDTNTKRIIAFNIRLDRERTRLFTQFYAMETAISKLQSNISSINSLQSLAIP